MKLHEYFDHGARHARVHGEVAGFLSLGVGITPVSGRAKPPHLARDGGARLLFPFPYALHERLAPEIVPRFSFGLELALDHDLRRDTGVIGTDHPVRVETAH